jgi:hypothetical protein
VFPELFFPEASPFMGTLLAFAAFGVGFAARPLGGVIFGHFGDRVGRKKMLVISLMITGVSTVLIGALPTYATVGALAPTLLVLLRLAQGIAVGGEWGGAVLMAVEHAPPGRRGFLSGALNGPYCSRGPERPAGSGAARPRRGRAALRPVRAGLKTYRKSSRLSPGVWTGSSVDGALGSRRCVVPDDQHGQAASQRRGGDHQEERAAGGDESEADERRHDRAGPANA